MTPAQLAPMIRQAMKDQSYRATPLGTMVGRYIRWLRNEYGATPATVRDYEAILARMCLVLADKDPIEVSIEDLRDVIDTWSTRTARTRQKVTSVIRAFWKWAEEQGHIAVSPASRIRRPRAESKVSQVLPLDARPRLLSAAKHPRDRFALFCLLGLGLRRSELAGIQFRDIDAQRRVLRVFGKGQKERLMPLRGPILEELHLLLSFDLPHVGRPPQGDDYLLYPIQPQANGKGFEGEMIWSYKASPKAKPSGQSVHRWWYRLAQEAGLVGHTFAMELRRVAGIDAASQALGHANLNTTLSIYGHMDASDLESAMGKYSDWLVTQDESIVPTEDS